MNSADLLSSNISRLFFRRLVVSACLLFFANVLSAQTPTPSKDTLIVYKKIQRIAYKHKLTTLLYKAIFVEPVPKKYEKKSLSDVQKQTDPNLKFEGRIIRNIDVLIYDPFGYSVNDTTRKEINPFQKAGNKYHVNSRHKIIKNLLLFKKNDSVELLVINESERIIRDASYINDCRIYITAVRGTRDSVDLLIVANDKWTLDATVSGSFTGGHARLRERNILGSGQQYSQFVGYDLKTGNYDYRGDYVVGNIKNTFISSSVYYTTTKDITSTGFSLNRPFYSALAKWAGGISGNKIWATYTQVDTIEHFVKKHRLDYISTDVWVARSFNPGTGKKINKRNINIVVALRYAETQFQSKPPYSVDVTRTNFNSTLYLSSVGFSLRKYYKDQFIYRFGANEDVPEGLVVQCLYGILYKEQNPFRYYTGFEVSRGKHFKKIGYLSGSLIYGTFYNKSIYKDATINAGLYYFSNLFESNKWYFRQFANYKFVYGFNKGPLEKITLRPDEMYGFNNGTLLGRTKMIINLEAVAYAPYNIIGFRFASLFLFGFGILETDKVKLFNSPVYQAYSTGLLIRNENLLNASFEITYGIYPNLPDGNDRFYKFNPVTSFTLKVRSFAISKPNIVEYN